MKGINNTIATSRAEVTAFVLVFRSPMVLDIGNVEWTTIDHGVRCMVMRYNYNPWSCDTATVQTWSCDTATVQTYTTADLLICQLIEAALVVPGLCQLFNIPGRVNFVIFELLIHIHLAVINSYISLICSMLPFLKFSSEQQYYTPCCVTQWLKQLMKLNMQTFCAHYKIA